MYMDTLIVVFIATGLAMDCFAVSISCGLSIKNVKFSDGLRMGVFFGFFQGFMAFLGWLGGVGFARFIEEVDHWVAISLLTIIGSKMIIEAFKDDSRKSGFNPSNFKVLLLLSIATSIDALVVGVSFAFLSITIFLPIILIGAVSFLFALFGTFIGDRLGHILENKIEILGGVILIGIGVKILLEHLFF